MRGSEGEGQILENPATGCQVLAGPASKQIARIRFTLTPI